MVNKKLIRMAHPIKISFLMSPLNSKVLVWEEPQARLI